MAVRRIVGPGAVKVYGLKEIRAGLKSAGPAFPRRLTQINKQLAQAVAAGARARGEQLTHPRPGHEALGTLKATAGQLSATVSLGSPAVPWALGEEFGSIKHHQFPPWRGNKGGAGYFFWPTIREDLPRLDQLYLDMIDDLAATAFPPNAAPEE